jgi:peptidoglycan hydrolase-like protein with peptidoglycan-binding domain
MAGAEVPAGAGGAEPDVKFEVLRKGSKGKWVERVQKALQIHVDGDFGPQTEAAVMAFQEANGLTRDGIVGRNT